MFFFFFKTEQKKDGYSRIELQDLKLGAWDSNSGHPKSISHKNMIVTVGGCREAHNKEVNKIVF